MELAFKELLQKGTLLATEKKLAEALSLYQNWIQSTLQDSHPPVGNEMKSRMALVYNNMGQIKYLNVDFHGAVKDYTEAISYDPDLASAYYNRGTIMYRMGDFQNAMNDLAKATELSPDNQEFQLGLERTKSQIPQQESS